MKTAITLFFLLASFNLYSQSTWVQQNSGTNKNLNSVKFINSYTGIIVGDDGIILRTTNSGDNWTTISSNITNDLLDLVFTNGQVGYAVEDFPRLTKTTDGGISWFQVWTPSNPLDIHFLNADTGFAVCGSVVRTTNGGSNWESLSILDTIPNVWPTTGVVFFDYNTGYAGCQQGLYKTTNAGVNWFSVYPAFTYPSNFEMYYDSLCFGLRNGPKFVSSITYVSFDKGLTWNNVKTGANNVSFCNTRLGFGVISTVDAIMKTTNGGTHWTSSYNGFNFFPQDVDYLDSLTAYVVGYFGQIYTTRTGGINSLNPISSEIPTKYLLRQNYPNPFNPSTNIKFDIPRNDFVKIAVYDLLGKEVAVLVNEELKAGTYETQWNAESFPSGIYIVKMVSNSYFSTQKMILLK